MLDYSYFVLFELFFLFLYLFVFDLKFALFAKWESKRGLGGQYAVEKFCFSHSRAPRLKQISYRSTTVADNTLSIP